MINIVETAIAAGTFKILMSAVDAAHLKSTLSEEGPYTVFAPNDSAFSKLPPGKMDKLFREPVKLKEVLSYHVVSGKLMASDAAKLTSAITLQGQHLNIAFKDNTLMVNDAKVVKSDIIAENGVIHVIDQVLIPK